jgi:hypothetical protein
MMPGNSSSALRTIVSSSSLVAAAARESAPFETSSHSWPADLGLGRYHIRFALRFLLSVWVDDPSSIAAIVYRLGHGRAAYIAEP